MIPYSIFHEPWWLNAVCPHGWDEAVVTHEGQVVARMPYVYRKQMGIKAIGMPPLTRTLGPQFVLTEEMAGPRMHQEDTLMQELVGKLPPHHHFFQICTPGFGNGLSFVVNGFQAKLAYTFQIPKERSLDVVWRSMRDVTRQAIRKAARTLSVDRSLDIEEFCAFYNENLEANHEVRRTGQSDRHRNKVKIRLYDAGMERGALCLLAARGPDKQLLAAIMPVWAHGVMHYFLTTRSPAAANSGAVALLVWTAMQQAKQQGLVFDFDGFARPEAAGFVAGFGGDLVHRVIATKESHVTSLLRDMVQAIRRV